MTHLPFQYGTTRNFLGLPNYSNQPFVILGAPVDGATTFRSGTRHGPNAIRDASMMLTDGVHPLYPVDLKLFVGDAGDMALPTGSTTATIDMIKMYVSGWLNPPLLNGIKPPVPHIVTLGGDHSITDGILRGLKNKHQNMAIVHFDAHCDTWDDHFGEPKGHGTWLNHIVNDNIVGATHVISIGIRSPSDLESQQFLTKNGGTTISASMAMKYTPERMAELIKSVVGDVPVYLSLDIDCLDPAYAPGTGTPEIGGLSSLWLRDVIDELGNDINDLNWIGMDCVEVSPPYDHSSITALAAATFCWQYLSINAASI